MIKHIPKFESFKLKGMATKDETFKKKTHTAEHSNIISFFRVD